MSALALCLALAITDGDTIRCGAERVRIFGLDCPERRDPGGPAATKALTSLLNGRTITIQRRGHDRYGRTVAKVFADGRDVTAMMISSGVCTEYCRYSRGEYGRCSR